MPKVKENGGKKQGVLTYTCREEKQEERIKEGPTRGKPVESFVGHVKELGFYFKCTGKQEVFIGE